MTTEERRAAGRRINPITADVWFEYGETLDPYGEGGLPDELSQIGRNFFARDPGERIPVCFCDLDEVTARALEAERDRVHREGWNDIAAGMQPAEMALRSALREWLRHLRRRSGRF